MSNYSNPNVQRALNCLLDAVAVVYMHLQEAGENHDEIVDEIANAVDVAIEEAPGLIMEWTAEANSGFHEHDLSYGIDY
jgi:hypothetical protein